MVRVSLAAWITSAVVLVAHGAQASETAADWLRKPTQTQLFGVWPTEAMKKGINGRAVITCKISVQGALFGCRVDEESPAGMGFGAAAIALTPQFLMRPATRDGKPVESEVRIPINFTGLSPTSTGSRIAGNNPDVVMTRKVVSDVLWNEAPAYDDVAAAYPAKARAAGVGGRATLSCTLREDGRLNGCSAVAEEPKGQGFAAAARTLTPKFLSPTQFQDGSSTKGAMTQVPFVFALDMLDPTRRVIGRPQWAVMPTGDVMLAGYPKAAIDAGVKTARVVMVCTAGAGGALQGCALQSEEPAGLGFGAAGLELSKTFRIRPWTAEGLPTIGGQIRVPIRYVLPEDEKAAPVAPAKP